MLDIIFENRYKKDAKRYRHDAKALAAVGEVLQLLLAGQPLPPKYKEHTLLGEYAHYLECHCQSDLLLIYQRTATTLKLARLGSHAELFR